MTFEEFARKNKLSLTVIEGTKTYSSLQTRIALRAYKAGMEAAEKKLCTFNLNQVKMASHSSKGEIK